MAYTKEEAENLGFTQKREDVLRATGWSKATLGRKMIQKMAEGTDYVYVEGKTKPTPVFKVTVLKLAGIEIAEAEGHGAVLALEKTSGKIISQSGQNNLVKNSQGLQGEMERIERALILPHKLYYTLREAAMLTGLPQSALQEFSEKKFGRRVIARAVLRKV